MSAVASPHNIFLLFFAIGAIVVVWDLYWAFRYREISESRMYIYGTFMRPRVWVSREDQPIAFWMLVLLRIIALGVIGFLLIIFGMDGFATS
jgi:hypothetical protein